MATRCDTNSSKEAYHVSHNLILYVSVYSFLHVSASWKTIVKQLKIYKKKDN
jgi:hypothetical protein